MKRVKSKNKVLAYGEHTGHMHRVTVEVYDREDGVKEFEGATTITHEEHKPVVVPDGEWCAGQVQEFDHVEQQLRTVRD